MDIQAKQDQNEELQHLAKEHLLMQFTHRKYYHEKALTVMDRGEGCWVWDKSGKKFMDALGGLFCLQVGYSHGEEIGEAVKRQMSELPYFTNWSCAHEPSIRLAAKIASLAPDDLSRVFFTSSGSESNEAAIKLVRQYHHSNGEPSRRKFIARRVAYHGTSYGALSLNGMTDLRKDFEPLMSGVRHVNNTNRYRRPEGETEEQFTQFLLDEIESLIIQEGPNTVAGIFIEPLQNAGGSFTPPAGYTQGLREICDKYGVLLVADEVICGFGRLGEWFGCTRYGLKPDVITFAKGVASGHIPLGGLITSNKVMTPILENGAQMFLHGLTYGGHPVACAAALANIEILERENIIGNVKENAQYFKESLQSLRNIALVGDVRGDGYHYSVELVTNREGRCWDSSLTVGDFVAEHLEPALYDRGLLFRVAIDQRGTPLVQMSPPLIMTRDEIDWLVSQLNDVLSELSKLVSL